MGSFIRAANAMELPRASVSAAIQKLEADLGTRLLHRTTRRVRLTSDGARLLERLRPVLSSVEGIDALFRTASQDVAGRLNVDAPSRIARKLITPALPQLLGRYPQLQVRLGSSDRAIDLIREGVDCVVRVGVLPDSSLVGRRLGQVALINCASPGYLRERGVPMRPDDLRRGHHMVGYASSTTGRELPWEYVRGEKELEIPVTSQVVVNNAEMYIACCLAGLGLIQIPRFDVQHFLDSGRLVEVMPEYRPRPMTVSVLYAHRRQRSRRLIAFIDWFEALMRPYLDV